MTEKYANQIITVRGERLEENCKYFWIRIFDYTYDRDSNYENESYGKGILLDEFYTNDIEEREAVKEFVKSKFVSMNISFAKPKKKDGIYAIVMDSSEFFYKRFYKEIDTFCFWHECHKPVKGKWKDFPKADGEDGHGEDICFCSYDCRAKYYQSLNPFNEGEWQNKEEGCNGDLFGFIYLIYNRSENMNYIGQTRFYPFFRWQEHVKSGLKGDIKDLVFSVITEVPRNRKLSEKENQEYLNSIEAWWISKYIEEGKPVKNLVKPRITIDFLRESFDKMYSQNYQVQI